MELIFKAFILGSFAWFIETTIYANIYYWGLPPEEREIDAEDYYW